ncbi:MAG TPA: STAS-like domain-containing protein [Candidatus Peribacteraceae bacterium]|nr:MAG: hypothetical protein A2635_04875 [Candidatus Peribacteria bacterium RIFCSPHIGHO2_01_FULL_51_9]HLD71320.1 STAS-like domain-containing protein [Candidatus Peribacteraceae bacterium]
MILLMRNFGEKLDSRPAGREAWLAMQPRLREISPEEKMTLDFDGVLLLTPSFADEFVTRLLTEYPQRVILKSTNRNVTVQKTLEFLRETWERKPDMQ